MSRNTRLMVAALVMLLGSGGCGPLSAATSALPTPVSAIPTASCTPSPVAAPTVTVPSVEPPAPTPTETPAVAPMMTPCPNPTPGGSVGQILFSADEWRSGESYGGSVTSIYLINSDGSGLRQIYEGRGSIGDLQLSPDGTKLAFSDNNYVDINEQRFLSRNVYVLDFASGRARPLAPEDAAQQVWGARWVSNETLVYSARATEPEVSSSDIHLTDLSGGWRQQITNRPYTRTSILDIAVSPDGEQLLFTEFALDFDVTTVYRINTDGTELRELMVFSGTRTADVAWSPTGDRMAISAIPFPISSVSVYLADPSETEMRKIADLQGQPILLAWTEDLSGLIFYMYSGTLGTNEIIEVRADASVRLLATGEVRIPGCSFADLSPDQGQFACSPFPLPGLYVMDISGDCHYQTLSNYGVVSVLWLPEDVSLQPGQ